MIMNQFSFQDNVITEIEPSVSNCISSSVAYAMEQIFMGVIHLFLISELLQIRRYLIA